jgi:hypothetical protein
VALGYHRFELSPGLERRVLWAACGPQRRLGPGIQSTGCWLLRAWFNFLQDTNRALWGLTSFRALSSEGRPCCSRSHQRSLGSPFWLFNTCAFGCGSLEIARKSLKRDAWRSGMRT